MSERTGGRAKVFKAAGEEVYVVVTGTRGDGLEYGRIVRPGSGTPPGPERPTQTITAFMPMVDFQPYHGDPAPILALLKGD